MTCRYPFAVPSLALRGLFALAVGAAFCSPAMALVTPHKGPSPRAAELLRARLEVPTAFTRDDDYHLTDQTEVKLNGHKCRYDEVPDGAEIIFMEIDSDASRQILQIHFRSRK